MREATAARAGEAGLLGLIARWLGRQEGISGLVRGVGDDCAVARPAGRRELLTVDAFVEGVHFSPRWLSPRDAGWKALAANVSDIAAAGGVPACALVSLELPPALRVSWLRGFYSGLLSCARAFGVAVAGGNISRSSHFAAHIALTGRAGARIAGRGGARPGDVLAVTGKLGGSLSGLLCLRRGIRGSAARAAVRRHLHPVPRVAAGVALARVAHAVVDISDGLVHEANLLAASSGVRVYIDAMKVPVHPAARILAPRLRRSPAALALASGEEYELLAALPPARVPRPLAVVGRVERGRGVRVSGAVGAATAGFDHFKST